MIHAPVEAGKNIRNAAGNEYTREGESNEPKHNPPHSDHRIRLRSLQGFLLLALGSDPCAQQRALHRAGGNPARKENNHLIR